MATDRPHVIVVNDDLVQLGLTARLIKHDGASVRTFHNAPDALVYIDGRPDIDLIVTDLRMPGIDGWRFCRLLRSPEFPHTNDTPILVISAAFSQHDVGPNLPDRGIDAFLSIPYSVDELKSTVRTLLQQSRKRGRPLALIVGTEARERERLATGLTSHGYGVVEAEGEEQAVHLYQKYRPDLVLLDHDPPQLDASRVLPTLKQKADSSAIVVIADSSSADIAIGLALLGADVYLHRPLEQEHLARVADLARREKALQHVEGSLSSWTEHALHDAQRMQRLNDCFLSLSADHADNIQKLAQTAGELLNAACTFYRGMVLGSTPPVHEQVQQQVQTSTPCVIRDVQRTAYADVDPRVRGLGIQTLVECPIEVEGLDVGSLWVGWTEDREPADDDLSTLNILARAIGLQERMQQREQELIALNEIGRVVTSALTLEEMLALLRAKVRDVLDAEACSIALVDRVTGELVFQQADDPFAEALVGRRLQPGQGVAGQVAQSGRSALIPDVMADPRFYGGFDAVTGLSTRSIVCAPLIAKDRAIGIIELVNKREGAFTEEDVRVLEAVAAQTAAAIENARLHEATQRELFERIQAERRLQTLIDAAPDLIYLKDRNLRYLLVNQAFADFWGLRPDEVTGKTDLDLLPEDAARDSAQSDRLVLDVQHAIIEERQEGERLIETRKAAVLDDDGRATGIAGIIRDITDRRRMEEQLSLEQKEESVLTLASGIAHDFNNALVGIVGNVDLLRMDLPEIPTF